MNDGTAIDQIVAALEAGQSTRRIQRQFGLTLGELDEALQQAFPLDQAARLRAIRGDLAKLDQVIAKLYEKTLAGDGDSNAAVACIRALERKAQMLGTDCAQRIDLTITPLAHEKSDHEKIRDAIYRVARPERYQQAIASTGNGNGAVDALSQSDDTEPSR